MGDVLRRVFLIWRCGGIVLVFFFHGIGVGEAFLKARSRIVAKSSFGENTERGSVRERSGPEKM